MMIAAIVLREPSKDVQKQQGGTETQSAKQAEPKATPAEEAQREIYEQRQLAEQDAANETSNAGSRERRDPLDAIDGVRYTATKLPCYFNGGTYVVFSRQNGEQLVLGGQVQESSARSSFSFQTLNDSEVFYKQQWFANEAVERFLNDANAISRENLSRITMESSVV
ncbi:MAG: hypothetical protein FJW31_02040 [Acidobacteria bacterium]|nr:hypothetical protein [Acidobacteriota bacterium]